MPSEELMLIFEEEGADRTARKTESVGRSVRKVGDDSKKSANKVGIFERAWRVLTTRMILWLGVAALVSVAMAGLTPAVLALVAGAVAFGAVFAPALAIGVGVFQMMSKGAGAAGTAMQELHDALDLIKHAWRRAISPAAAIVMRAIADAIYVIAPALEAMRGPLKVFARYMGQGIKIMAEAFIQMQPQLMALLRQAGPFMVQLAKGFGPLMQSLIALAQVGMPVLSQLLTWLISLLKWLPGAVHWADKFLRSASLWKVLKTIWGYVVTVAEYVWDVLSDLAEIVYQLWQKIQPLAKILGGALLVALEGIRIALDWVNKHFQTLWKWIGPLLVILGVGAGLAGAFWLVSAAVVGVTMALNFLAANWILVAIALIAYGLYELYTHAKWFRDGINWIWQALQDVFNWVTQNWQTVLTVLFGPAGWLIGQLIVHWHEVWDTVKSVWNWIGKKIHDVVDFIRPAIMWVFDKIKWIIGKAKPLKDAVGWAVGAAGDVAGFVNDPLGGVGLATGGTVQQGGWAVVGERGPEMVNLPTGSKVHPHGAAPPQEIHVHATLVMPDGQVLAQQTLKAATWKRSVR